MPSHNNYLNINQSTRSSYARKSTKVNLLKNGAFIAARQPAPLNAIQLMVEED